MTVTGCADRSGHVPDGLNSESRDPKNEISDRTQSMKLQANHPTCPSSRPLICPCVLEEGWTLRRAVEGGRRPAIWSRLHGLFERPSAVRASRGSLMRSDLS
jgi:hypothetical protein